MFRSPCQLCLLVISLIANVRPQFEYKDTKTVAEIVTDATKSAQCNCIAILRPDDVQNQSVINNLAIRLAKRAKITTTMTTGNFYENREGCNFQMNVVMVTNGTGNQLSRLSGSHFFHQPFWLIFANRSNFLEILQNVHIQFNTKLWVVQPETYGRVTLNQIFQTGPSISRKIYWVPGTTMKFTPFHDPQKMKGLVLKIATFQYMSYVITELNSDGRINSISGFYGQIWKDVEQDLQFQSDYIQPADRKFGSLDETGNWTGMYGMVIRNEVDVVLNDMTITTTRSPFVQFLHPTERTEFKIFYKTDAEFFDWLKVFRPFDFYIWLALLISIIIIGTAVYVVIEMEKTMENSARHVSLLSCIYYILRALSNQGSETVPKLWALRILFLTAYLLATVIVPAYSASLIAVLTLKTPVEPFKQLTDIISTDYKLAIAANTSDYDFFQKSSDETYRKIYQISVLKTAAETSSYTSAINHVCKTHKAVFFGTLGELTAFSRQEKLPCNLAPIKSEISPAYKTIVVQKHSPYGATLKKPLLKMLENGLIDRNRKLYMPKAYEIKQATEIGIGLVDIGSVFIYFGILLIFSLVIFCIEATLSPKNPSYLN